MEVILMTDLEGMSGVDRLEQVSEVGTPGHRYALERLMLDVNAAVDGAFAGGATRVYVVDGHGGGKNFLEDLLSPRATWLKQKGQWQDYIKAGRIAAYMEVGCHAMAGTINGFLDHTQSSRTWFNYIVNGRKSGEIAQGAIFAGAYGVPFVMVSGDEAACVEAKAFLGDLACAVVKYGVGRNKARLVDPQKALDLIREAARDGMGMIDKIKPYRPLLPLELILEVNRSDAADEIMQRRTDAERLDARTIRRTVHEITSYYDILF